MTIFLRLCSALLLVFWMACGAQAEEVIRDYHADITVFPDATIEVTETITVNAEGNRIQRGIFRDFPLYAQDARGFRQKVDFELISVERDGQPEANHTESITGGIRIYAGSGDVFLQPGEYTYTITYRTGRQIRYFDDHDELYWNVTGNGWLFPIEEASVKVFCQAIQPRRKPPSSPAPWARPPRTPARSRDRTVSNSRPRDPSAQAKA